jgi:hypothetical protein
VARARPGTTFYAYTKALPFWARRLAEVGTGHDPGPVANFVLTASHGGTHDRLIGRHGLRSARVVLSEQEAADLGLEMDHDDWHARRHGPDFALLIHGPQPQGSAAAAAVAELRALGGQGYGARADAARARAGRRPLPLIEARRLGAGRRAGQAPGALPAVRQTRRPGRLLAGGANAVCRGA